MSQQEQKDSGFLQNEYEEAVKNKQDDDGSSLGSFLEEQLSEEEEDGQGGHFTTPDYSPHVYYHSSEEMPELDDESVHFAITSPPYNTGWNYGSYDDAQDYATEYLPMLARVFKEVHRVLVPGGRFCVNVPSLLRSGATGGFPIAADITNILISDHIEWIPVTDSKGDETSDIHKTQVETDFVMREQIAWNKGFNTDGLAPNGSFPRPWGVLLNNMHEVILVFQKPGQRDYDDMDEEIKERSKINKRDSDMCDDVWSISPESWSPKYIEGEDIPVFPDKLVRRAIQLWSYEEDVVLDPFAGRFTTGKVAKQERRHGVGYELREELRKDIEEYTNKNQSGLFQFE